MTDHANIESPLVAGPTVKLESLFADRTCVRSARSMQHDLLPVYVTDPQHMASPLLVLLAYDQHERFEAWVPHEAPTPCAAPVASGVGGAGGQADGVNGQRLPRQSA
jgi:hypothetical protein